MPGTSLSLESDAEPRLQAAPITVVRNSGAGSKDQDEVLRKLKEICGEAGRELRIIEPRGKEGLDAICERVAPDIAAEGGTIVAAGGDGTVSAVAAIALAHKLPLGILPLGTFNYFARDHGVPTDLEAAARTLVDGRIATASAGKVNGQLFINNASIGLYTELIRRRERAKAQFGRRRIVAALSAAAALVRGQRPFSIHLAGDALANEVRTSMLFASCNGMQLEGLGLGIAACSDAGTIGVILLKPTTVAERLRLIGRAMLKNLDEDPALESFCTAGFEVSSRRRSVKVVIDGELKRMRMPLTFKALPDALKIVVPREAS